MRPTIIIWCIVIVIFIAVCRGCISKTTHRDNIPTGRPYVAGCP